MTKRDLAMGRYEGFWTLLQEHGPELTAGRIEELADGKGPPATEREVKELALLHFLSSSHNKVVLAYLEEIEEAGRA